MIEISDGFFSIAIALQVLLAKMTASSNKKFPWGKGIILLLLLTGAVVGYDTYKHGNFEGNKP